MLIVLLERMEKMMQDEIKHDPVMWERYVEAMNAEIELEIKLVKESNNEQISTMV